MLFSCTKPKDQECSVYHYAYITVSNNSDKPVSFIFNGVKILDVLQPGEVYEFTTQDYDVVLSFNRYGVEVLSASDHLQDCQNYEFKF